MKTHLNLATSDLDRAVSFYSILLDAKPAKTLTDYALFITEQPALELALDLRDVAVLPSDDVHYGICVETPDEVNHAIDRLTVAGLAASVEREETCCYANQTKVWAIDPDGRHWEVYTVHEEADTRNDDDTSCCSSDPQTPSCLN
jgi:catechol 2,3-dioxygenase-like lactoylglutathione lyase family enzyme